MWRSFSPLAVLRVTEKSTDVGGKHFLIGKRKIRCVGEKVEKNEGEEQCDCSTSESQNVLDKNILLPNVTGRTVGWEGREDSGQKTVDPLSRCVRSVLRQSILE